MQIWEHITGVVARLKPDEVPQIDSSPEEAEEELIEYEGMLISAAAAQRRRRDSPAMY